jgi:hypothetical protein
MIVEGKKDEKAAGGNPMGGMGGMEGMYWLSIVYSFSIKKFITLFLIMHPLSNKLHSPIKDVLSLFIDPLKYNYIYISNFLYF